MKPNSPWVPVGINDWSSGQGLSGGGSFFGLFSEFVKLFFDVFCFAYLLVHESEHFLFHVFDLLANVDEFMREYVSKFGLHHPIDNIRNLLDYIILLLVVLVVE